jgi:hypothetical protein
VLLDLLHRALRVERADDRPELVHPRLVRNRLARVLGRTREAKGLGTVEGDGETLLARGVSVGTLEGGLLSILGLGLCGWPTECSGMR